MYYIPCRIDVIEEYCNKLFVDLHMCGPCCLINLKINNQVVSYP